MKTICLYFEIHQNIQLKRYRFFDIGTDHYYYDDYENERLISDIAERSYMPALNALLEMIKENGNYFKVAFSLSGVGIEQLEKHAPQVLEKLQELNQTGCVEFLAEPYSHGLASLANEESFAAEVKRQCTKMEEYFGQTPKVLRNSSLIYSDDIGLLRERATSSAGSRLTMYITALLLLISSFFCATLISAMIYHCASAILNGRAIRSSQTVMLTA